MAILGALTKVAIRNNRQTHDMELSSISACMAAMLDGIAALEVQGILGDGFAATAQATETACGTAFDVVLTITAPAKPRLASPRL